MTNKIAIEVIDIFHKRFRARANKLPTEIDVALATELDTLNLDSLDNMQLIIEIKERFGIVLDETEIIGTITISNIVGLAACAKAKMHE